MISRTFQNTPYWYLVGYVLCIVFISPASLYPLFVCCCYKCWCNLRVIGNWICICTKRVKWTPSRQEPLEEGFRGSMDAMTSVVWCSTATYPHLYVAWPFSQLQGRRLTGCYLVLLHPSFDEGFSAHKLLVHSPSLCRVAGSVVYAYHSYKVVFVVLVCVYVKINYCNDRGFRF